MRKIIFLTALISLVLPATVFSQGDRARLGESLKGKIIRSDKSEFDIGVKIENGKIVVDKGEFKSVRLPNHIGVVYGFLVQWGKGAGSAPPTLVAPSLTVKFQGKQDSWRALTLTLPFKGLSTIRSNGKIVGVKVGSYTKLTAIDGTEIKGKMIVEVEPRHDVPNKFRVSSVVITEEIK